MNCPKCQFENIEGVKFCVECGNKLELLCPKCGFSNSPSYKFCGDCGHNMTQPFTAPPKDLSFDEKIAKLQKYLPSGITEKILSQRDRIEGEKRLVTVMFCDMKGFTPLSEKLGPETMYAVMDEVYEILIHKVHDYEGTVNEMTGDGVMALFGAPIALEDAPQRAIRSAMAIHREMTRLNERMRQDKGEFPSLKMRIGIHTGPVVVGTLGNDLRVEFKAVGDTVNLASRMESLAEPGTTYISEDTFKITEGLFRVEALGEREIKGKEKPLKAYQVIAPSSRRTRFDVSAERGLTPFVGRQRELELLLDGFERSREGRGQAISIISEAGIGKSRLLYEFRKAVTNEDVTFLEGRCLSYSRNVAYHPIVDILKANFEIQDNDTDQQVKEKVTSFLKIAQVDESSTLTYLLELLSVKESGIEKMQMSPEARKDRTLEALKKITLKGSELRPLIMAVEDLHWMDRSSEDALKELLESISGSRVFLIFTYRPEFVHTWGSRSYHSQVTLNKLSNRESLAMVSYLLNTTNVDKDIEDLTLSKAEGIPFFIEEFIKSLRELKIIGKVNGTYKLTKDLKAISIPSTIQDVIMARVDHLPEGAREVLRTGSVIEREFSHELIQKVTGLPEQQLLSDLSTLRDSELLYERGIYPNSTYIFKHALTREVAYDSILTKKRKQIHEKIARTIEEIYRENICDCYGVLANHCMACDDYEKGAEYARLEARRYQKAGSFNDAIEYAKRRVACLEKLPQTDNNQRKIIEARVSLANYNNSLSHIVEAKEAVEPIVDLAIKMNYQRMLPGIYNALAMYSFNVDEDISSGLSYFNKAISISEEVGDAVSLWITSIGLGWCLSCNCEFEKSLTFLKRMLDISELANMRTGIVFSKNFIAQNYGSQGNFSQAHKVAEESLRMVEEAGDTFAKGSVYIAYGSTLYYKGLFDDAEKYFLEGLPLCAKHSLVNFEGWGITHLAFTYFSIGQYKKAQDYHNKAISVVEKLKVYPSWGIINKAHSARARAYYNQRDINIGEIIESSKSIRIKSWEGWVEGWIGDILLHMDGDHLSDAEGWIQKAIDAHTRNRMRWNLAYDHALYADFFKKKGDTSKAKEQLTKAIDLFKECDADGWVTRTEKTFAELK
jgi:class 3 adenylate cyclase/tetratricopeptide (TPR) repeat protein